MAKNKRWSFVPQKCPHCLKWFGTAEGFADHMKHKHPEKVEQSK